MLDIFKLKLNEPGLGVPHDAPRKKGFSRFAEVLSRDAFDLIKLNLLVIACTLPSQGLFGVAILFGRDRLTVLLLVIAAVSASAPVGAALTGFYHILSRMLIDSPRFIWHDFSQLFRENFKQALIPGIVLNIMSGIQLLFVLAVARGMIVRADMIMLLLVSALLFHMTAPYFFLQMSYLPLKTGILIKNSLLLMLGALPRSFATVSVRLAWAGLGILFFPFSFFPWIFAGCALPGLGVMMFLWKPVDRTFGIENTLKERALMHE